MKIDWTKITPRHKFLAAMQILHDCQKCGKCCVDMSGIAFNSADAVRMAKELDIRRNDFVKDYTIASKNKPTDRWLNTKGPNHACVFWSEAGCTRYLGRGQVCRLYPWTTPQQTEYVLKNRGWILYDKCLGMSLTYEKVLLGAMTIPMPAAKAILESNLGDICYLNYIEDCSTREAAEFAAKELGLESKPTRDRLYNIAWNYAIATVAMLPLETREAELTMARRDIQKHTVT